MVLRVEDVHQVELAPKNVSQASCSLQQVAFESSMMEYPVYII